MASKFPAAVILAAQESHKRYYPKGPFVSVTLAQWGIESAYGTREPTDSQNPFGIKAIPGQAYVVAMTREVLHGQSVTIPQHFAKYASLTEAFDAHAKLLATSPIYAEAQAATTPESYVRAMAKHYATAPNYADVLLSVMRAANLYQFDAPVQAAPASPPPTPTPKSGEGGASVPTPDAPPVAAPAPLATPPIAQPTLEARVDAVQAKLATVNLTPAHESWLAQLEDHVEKFFSFD